MSQSPLIVGRVPRRGDGVSVTNGPGLKLGREIGRGGQGAVFEVEGNPHRCVKLYFEPDSAKADRLRQRFNHLRSKNVNDDPRLVLPTDVLSAPATGYVMRRVTDADPLSFRAIPARGEPIGAWFARTGGLRGRLLLAHELVRAFRDLHLRGLSFGDLSWENVLVPRRGRPSVHLIDCDNLSVDGASPPSIIGTPWFIAPEVLQGTHHPDAISDQHSLSVLLYHMLVLTHPLLGDAIRDGSPEAEQEALSGFWPGTREPVPWIDSSRDDRNRTRQGLPRAMVLSRLLTSLFERSFESGLLGPDRARRPTEGAWLDAIGRALDATTSCVQCEHTFFLTAPACPWCRERRFVPWVLLCSHGDGRRPVVVQQQRRLYARHLRLRGQSGDDNELARVRLDGDGLVLVALAPILLTRDGRSRLVQVDEEVRLSAGDVFQLGQDGAPVEVKANEVQ